MGRTADRSGETMIVAIFEIFLVSLPVIAIYKIVGAFVYRFTKSDDRPGTTCFITSMVMGLLWIITPNGGGDGGYLFMMWLLHRYFLASGIALFFASLYVGHDSIVNRIRGD